MLCDQVLLFKVLQHWLLHKRVPQVTFQLLLLQRIRLRVVW